jgi:hypothetical protein
MAKLKADQNGIKLCVPISTPQDYTQEHQDLFEHRQELFLNGTT